MAHISWSSESEKEKKVTIFGEIRPYKQRQEERFETVELKNCDKREAKNNDQENEHTIIVPDTQDVATKSEKMP